MIKPISFFILFALTMLSQVTGQNLLILEHQHKKHRYMELNAEREYFLITKDTTYFSSIISFTDSTLSVYGKIKHAPDTTFINTQELIMLDDTVYRVKHKPAEFDTIILPFSEIISIKKYWFKDQNWLESFAWLSLGIVLAVPLLPVVAIDKGWEGVIDWALFEAYLIGICVPPMFIGTRKSNFNLTKTWTLKTLNVRN